MLFHIITIFPEIFNSYFNESILKRAQEKGIIEVKIHNLRKWTADKHKTVDDSPYGGGAGMIMKVEPIYKALCVLKKQKLSKHNKQKIVLLSAKGKTWSQQTVKRYVRFDEIILICGRYEGVDERITKFIDDEISIGDYILTGGEIPAMAVVDSITRLLPGSLGNIESVKNESYVRPNILEYPQYTRPEIFKVGEKKYKVPEILLSGNHKKIKEWKEKNFQIKKKIKH